MTMQDTQANETTNNGGPRPSDKWIPLYLIGGFLLLLLPLGPMAYYAIHTLPGVVTDNAYEKGLAYNAAIEAGSKAAALGWSGAITTSQDKDGKTRVVFVLRDKNGNPLNDAKAHVYAVRPTTSGLDKDTDMQVKGNGRYEANLALAERGVWDLRVSATRGTDNYQTDTRGVLK